MGDDPELRRLLELVQARLAATESSPTVAELCTAYDRLIIPGLKPRSRVAVRARFKKLLPFWGPRVASRLAMDDESEWRSLRLGAKTLRKTLLCARTYCTEVHALLALLNWAVHTKRLGNNPIRGVKLPKFSTKRKTRYTESDMVRLFSVSGIWLQCMMLFIADSGLRPAEVLTLDEDQVDMAGKLYLRGDQTKNGEPRAVPLSARTVATVKALPRYTGPRKQFTGSLVFTNPNSGKGWSQSSVGQWWREARRKTGLKGAAGEIARLYDWRHTFGSGLNKAKVPLPTIKNILGHQSYRYIGVYVEADDDDVSDAGKALEQLRAGPKRAEPLVTIPKSDTEQAN